MNIKKINFLCGLPRSGSTLLATLLNQHPQIYASPNSDLLNGISQLHKAFSQSVSVAFGLRVSAYQETIWTAPQIFYGNISKTIIFDKQCTWSTPDNYKLALKIGISPRFIVCYRPVLEVLASYVCKSIDSPDYWLNKELEKSNFYAKNYLDKNDALAEYLMCEHPFISQAILGLAHAKKNEDTGMFKFVSYDDLVNNTQEIMQDIFELLKIEPAEINTQNIKNIFRYNDSRIVGIEGFHTLRPVIKKESTKPEDLFSNFILNKYKDALSPINL